jgi:CO/xanthine dehydrogenase FAD-binding subunit
MEVLRPLSLSEALEAKAKYPSALPLAGGTDVMVEINFGQRRPSEILDLTRIEELREWSVGAGEVRIGAGLPYTRVIDELGDLAPGLAIAARTVGSPQIRNRGTIGGNIGAASPAGDSHPPLLAAGAKVELRSASGTRWLPAAEVYLGPKRNALAAEEMITAVQLPVATGPQQFAKIGTRNAMVISVCSFALAIYPDRRRVGTGIGSAGPTPLRATEAERFLEGLLEEGGHWEDPGSVGDAARERFGELVAAGASPIDDVRGTAAYRRHALRVLAGRTLAWGGDRG